MKKKLAKFAIFQIFESGADQLYKSRDENGVPFQTYKAANDCKELHVSKSEGPTNLIVRSV